MTNTPPPAAFQCEGVPDCLDEITLRHVSVWLAAITDTDGAVVIDLVSFTAPRNDLPAINDHDDDTVDTNPFRCEGTRLHDRRRLLPHRARRLAHALDVCAFIASGGRLD
jgi:hypothetical protein